MKRIRAGSIVAVVAALVSIGGCARREIVVESKERAVVDIPGGEHVIYDPYEVDEVDVLVPTNGGHRGHDR